MLRSIPSLCLTLALACAAGACASAPPPPPPAEQIPEAPQLDQDGFPGFAVVSRGVAISGQPNHYTRIEELKNSGYATLVNLRTAEEHAELEERTADHYGMRYEHIPVDGPDIRMEHADALAELLSRPDAYPLLMHCSSGSRAAGLWAFYLVRYQGRSAEEALDEIDALGLLKPELREVLERRMAGAD